MRFKKTRCKVVQLGQGNLRYVYRLGKELNERSPVERNLWVLVDKKQDMSHLCGLAAWKVNSTLGCRVASREREGIVPFYPHETLSGVLCPGLGPPVQERHVRFILQNATTSQKKAESKCLIYTFMSLSNYVYTEYTTITLRGHREKK